MICHTFRHSASRKAMKLKSVNDMHVIVYLKPCIILFFWKMNFLTHSLVLLYSFFHSFIHSFTCYFFHSFTCYFFHSFTCYFSIHSPAIFPFIHLLFSSIHSLYFGSPAIPSLLASWLLLLTLIPPSPSGKRLACRIHF